MSNKSRITFLAELKKKALNNQVRRTKKNVRREMEHNDTQDPSSNSKHPELFFPTYESTKGLNDWEKEVVLQSERSQASSDGITTPECDSISDPDYSPNLSDVEVSSSDCEMSNNRPQVVRSSAIEPPSDGVEGEGEAVQGGDSLISINNRPQIVRSSAIEPPSHVVEGEGEAVQGGESRSNEFNNEKKKKRHREPDFCFFCEQKVLNFARHITRHHALEIEVAKALSKPKNSKERKELLTALRKRGNYLLCSLKEQSKPMNKGHSSKDPDQFLPCPSCLGLYSKKILWRHKKNCCSSKAKGPCQGNAQNLLLTFNPLLDQQLKEKVFPQMRADNVSLVAKADKLICAYGSRYLKTHKEKHFINVTSRKMRELSRFLIEMRTIQPEISNLFSCLQPKYFDNIVQAVKNVAVYDKDSETFAAPTYALNMATSLKQVCDITLLMLAKQQGNFLGASDSAVATANINTINQLLTSQWKFEISAIASNDLNTKKWNKITIVPLASDLKLLSSYLKSNGVSAAEALRKEPRNAALYNDLLEICYCQVLLLNRKRPGELQRLPLHIYNLNPFSHTYEEFSEVISPTERILLAKFKRVVIRGKRGRGVPVLFSEEVQSYIQLLIESRQYFFDESNDLLFANPSSSTPIVGYKVIEKYANKCGAKNPAALTSTRLRKHLATMAQLFSMSSNDMEQLATFMGHTMGVHTKSYRLPDDVYQTAKMSKLLVIMEEGGAASYKGKCLDDIEVHMEQNLLTENSGAVNSDDDNDGYMTDDVAVNVPPIPLNEEQPIIKVTTKKRVFEPWTLDQKREVSRFFRNHIKRKVPPKKHECEELQASSSILKNKSWLKIKVLVQNMYTKKCKIYE